MLNLLARIANVIKNSKFDAFLEVLEVKNDEKQKNRRIARTLGQAHSVIKFSR